jgi:hypothetical protein
MGQVPHHQRGTLRLDLRKLTKSHGIICPCPCAPAKTDGTFKACLHIRLSTEWEMAWHIMTPLG